MKLSAVVFLFLALAAAAQPPPPPPAPETLRPGDALYVSISGVGGGLPQ